MITDLAIATIFFVLGLIPAYYFYRKSLMIKEPVYSIKSYNLFSDSAPTVEKLNVSYGNRKVENLTISKILFCNQGSDTIYHDDIETINHIAITTNNNDSKILDATILQINNLSSQFTLDFIENENKVIINFSYLDKNQGAVIQVIHTGLSSEDLQITGDIKSVSNLKRISPLGEVSDLPFKGDPNYQAKPYKDLAAKIAKSKRLSFLANILFPILVVLGIVAIFAVIFPDNFNYLLSSLGMPEIEKPNSENITGAIVFSVLVTLALTSILIMSFVSGRKRVPSGLEKFFE